MLTREQITERLESFRQEDWLALVLSRARKAPAKLGRIVRGLLEVDEDGDDLDDWDERSEARDAAHALLARLPPAERRRLFALLFPKLADHLEAGWNRVDRPSCGGRPFRAPGDDAALATPRVSWLTDLVEALRGYDPDVAWVAAYAPFVSEYGTDFGPLLAAAIDGGGPTGEEVFGILKESATNEH